MSDLIMASPFGSGILINSKGSDAPRTDKRDLDRNHFGSRMIIELKSL